jgi:hypothetical protein
MDEHNDTTDVVELAMGALDGLLETLQRRVIRPILVAGRYLAYGFVLLMTATVITVALVIGLVRFMDVYFFGNRVWISDVVVGALSLVIGLLIWRKRQPSGN